MASTLHLAYVRRTSCQTLLSQAKVDNIVMLPETSASTCCSIPGLMNKLTIKKSLRWAHRNTQSIEASVFDHQVLSICVHRRLVTCLVSGIQHQVLSLLWVKNTSLSQHQQCRVSGLPLPLPVFMWQVKSGWSAAKAHVEFEKLLQDPTVVKGRRNGECTVEVQIDAVRIYRDRVSREQVSGKTEQDTESLNERLQTWWCYSHSQKETWLVRQMSWDFGVLTVKRQANIRQNITWWALEDEKTIPVGAPCHWWCWLCCVGADVCCVCSYFQVIRIPNSLHPLPCAAIGPHWLLDQSLPQEPKLCTSETVFQVNHQLSHTLSRFIATLPGGWSRATQCSRSICRPAWKLDEKSCLQHGHWAHWPHGLECHGSADRREQWQQSCLWCGECGNWRRKKPVSSGNQSRAWGDCAE